MKYILIRDDDANFFTRPEMLEEVYGFIFENNIPINFAIIPAVNGAAKTESLYFGAGSPDPAPVALLRCGAGVASALK